MHAGAPKKKRPEWNIENSIALRLSLEHGGLAAFHGIQREESARQGKSMYDSAFDAGAAGLNAAAVL
jgi:hypothetical protein